MQITHEGLHWIIFYNVKTGLTPQKCIESFRGTFANEAPSEKTICNWLVGFRRDHASVSDESRDGRLTSVIVPKNIDAVHNMIQEVRYVTYRQIET